MAGLIQIYYYALINPEKLSFYISSVSDRWLWIHKIGIALLLTGSFFIIKENVFTYDWLLLIVYWLFFIFIIRMVSLFMNMLIFYSLKKEIPESISIKDKIDDSLKILEIGWLPFIFSVQFGILAYYFRKDSLFLSGMIILTIWQLYIWWKGIAFHYEWKQKKIFSIVIKNLILIIIFSFSYISISMLMIYTILS